MLIDARSVDDGADLRFDLVVVGGGPAGITVADRLRGSGLRVCLLEGGGRHPDLATQRLYRGENVGHRYYALDACRFRLFGGSTNRWGGWCRPLDPDDFAAHDWVRGSGWPIDRAQLEPFHRDAAALFGLPGASFAVEAWADRLPGPLPLGGGDLHNALFLYSSEVNFADEHAVRLEAADDVTVMLHANATEVLLDDAGARAGGVAVRTLTGRAFTVGARAVVVAAGGIENARLLLASSSRRPAGLGNEHDLVGRYFMEHLHVAAGHALLTPAAATGFYRKADYGGLKVRGVITPTPAAKERHRLLGTSIAIEEARYAFGTPFIGWDPAITFGPIGVYRRLRRGSAGPAAEWLKGMTERAWNLGRVARTARASRTVARAQAAGAAGGLRSLYFRSEQEPSPHSRVTLSDRRRDALGLPISRLDWKVGDVDTASIEGWLGVLGAELRERGLGSVIRPAPGWQEGVIGGPHHMGTTRMAADPRHGVVDGDGRVHSVPGLYLAGSSVFTTGGYANPTFTIVALALRLAEHLRGELAR